jgi:beta-glucosidase/6-phospho-beta-glucosidase/beta-galactosidase
MRLSESIWAMFDPLDERGSVNDTDCIRYLQAHAQALYEGIQEAANGQGRVVMTIFGGLEREGVRSQHRYRAYSTRNASVPPQKPTARTGIAPPSLRMD